MHDRRLTDHYWEEVSVERTAAVTEDIMEARSYVVVAISPDGKARAHCLIGDHADIEDLGDLFDDIFEDMISGD